MEEFNLRQVELLRHFMRNSDGYTDVITHQNKHGTSRATANNDLSYLAQAGYITKVRRSKKLVYMPNIAKIKKVFSNK